jgi:hemerythrin-like domain-containing protein
MDAITLLKKQHAEVKALFVQFRKAGSPDRQRAIFEEIADNLAAHCEIEEKIFYPSVFRDDTERQVKEAVEEHLSAKRVISDLLSMEPSDSQYEAKVKVLSDLINHHVEEEHEELFPTVREELPSKELKELGTRMESMFQTLMSGAPRKEVPSQTLAAAPLPQLASAL